MTTSIATIPGATATALILPENMTLKSWRAMGERLSLIERATGWWIGDWWNAYKPEWGEQAKLCNDPTWKGPSYVTCRKAGATCAAFQIDRRRSDLPFTHHAEVVSLAESDANALLDVAARERRDTGTLLPSRMLRQEVKARRREDREIALADDIKRASVELGSKLYGVILADPPWRFEPFSRESGMDRSAENHYPTLSVDELCEMGVPAAEDCALFLWATTPMLLEALDVMEAWGFDYRTHWVWVKPRIGTGYWNRSCHELLLLGVRGDVPAPAEGTRFDSVFEGEVGAHSVKPAAAAEMIEGMFPNADCLEMFSRAPRLGWDMWGAEAPSPDAERTVDESATEAAPDQNERAA